MNTRSWRSEIKESEWENLAQKSNYSSQTVAEIIGISSRQLQRLVRDKFGTTPSEWLNDLRLRDAAQRLNQGEMITTVALELGFSQIPNFSRAFRKKFHLSPSCYQAETINLNNVSFYDNNCRTEIIDSH